MSRDGSEGWAVGAKNATLYHYDGESWSLCDYFGVRGQLPPDSACAGVAGIRLFSDSNGLLRSVELRSIARVPLERDADPSNDMEFEAVAVGSGYLERPGANPVPVILRLRDGEWDFEQPEAREAVTDAAAGTSNSLGLDGNGLVDVAFTAPNHGWILARGAGRTSAGLFHYDGRRWIDCDIENAPCFDSEGRLSNAPRLTTAHVSGSEGEIGVQAAGERVYLFGTRQPRVEGPGGFGGSLQNCPAILYHERGEASWHGSLDGLDGSYDPGFDPSAVGGDKSRQCGAPEQMRVDAFMAGQRADGAYEGWAFGQSIGSELTSASASAELRVLRLSSDDAWRRFRPDDALSDYFRSDQPARFSSMLMLPAAAGELDAYLSKGGRLLRFNPSSERWDLADLGEGMRGGAPDNLAYDGKGGFWATRTSGVQHLLHYTREAHRPVFEEVANPLGANGYVTAATQGAGASFWLVTNSDVVFRYDRLTGWDRVRIPGWDPGQTVTRPSQALAIAVNQSGAGVVVGEQGRIAEIKGESVRLDPAAGTLCDAVEPTPPCGTGRDLRAAAIAPDGSAMVGGDGLALLWRLAGGEFHAIARPDAASQTRITGISMPAPDRAWLVTNTGLLYAGRMVAGGEWSWVLENVNERNDLLTLDLFGGQSALRAIAVDASGHGYAVGDLGVILERTGDGAHPWRRLDLPYLDNLTSVALAVGGGDYALVGGERGVVLTLSDERVALARPGELCCATRLITDQYTRMRPVVGLALLPGVQAGQTEAWAAIQGSPSGDSTLLHYASDPAEPLLRPNLRAEPLPDSSPPRAGEFSLAAFGGTRCLHPSPRCDEMALTNDAYEVYTQRILDEIATRAAKPNGPGLAIFTGDLADTIGAPGQGRNIKAPVQAIEGDTGSQFTGVDESGTLKLRRWTELVADRLADRGVPLFAAIGGGDISTPAACLLNSFCPPTEEITSLGENLTWREAMASRPAPWGSGDPIERGELRLEPIGESDLAMDADESGFGDVAVDDPDGEGDLRETRVKVGGAHTHYAADVLRGDERIARLIFVDSSLRSLSAADPIQNPFEPRGQLAWLREMLCTEGAALDGDDSLLDCTREPGQRAIVVSNAPTYSYGPGQNQTALDSAAFEQVLFEGDADLVISGRIGWNGLYYALAPLVHQPEPGGSYPEQAPEPLNGGNEPIPFVVASGAGAFSADGSGRAPEGFWHGYTIVRLDVESGKTIVEQRPVFDWLHVAGSKRVLGAGERLRLDGFGREPIADGPAPFDEVRDDEISSAAITHRYDLVVADPEQPWVPCLASDADCASLQTRLAEGSRSLDSARDDMGECDPYLCLPERVGAIDQTTGEVKAGNGKYPDTFAIAMLSVGDHVATYPLMFRKSPSFVVNPLRLPPPAPGPNPSVPNNPQAPPPPSVPKPNVPQPSLPELPALPGIPPLAAAQPPEPQPPAPPAPPPPAEQPSPLDLTVSPTALTVATPAAVIQPPTPPVNPAPPSGARREARQRQAATQKSGADSAETKDSIDTGDLADSPMAPRGAPMTRRDRTRPEPSFTAIARADQPSAWAQGLLYGGGITMAALALAAGFTTLRPGPRKRPEVPAPAWSRLGPPKR